MKSALDCIPCMVSHVLQVSGMVTDCPDTRKKIVKQAMARIADIDFDSTPPEMARTIHQIVRELTGADDPYRELKDQSTKLALELLPELETMVETAADKFETIVRLVIAGNIIDFGADSNFQLSTAKKRIMEVLSMPIDREAIRRLHDKMMTAQHILYLCDNCGEAVIDRLLIRPYRHKITIAVRGGAILNDVTRREATQSGLDTLAPLIDSGDRTPGTVLKFTGKDFQAAFQAADLIISKGQGNYETLSDTDRPICFLLRVKCPEVAKYLDCASLGSLYVIPRNF